MLHYRQRVDLWKLWMGEGGIFFFFLLILFNMWVWTCEFLLFSKEFFLLSVHLHIIFFFFSPFSFFHTSLHKTTFLVFFSSLAALLHPINKIEKQNEIHTIHHPQTHLNNMNWTWTLWRWKEKKINNGYKSGGKMLDMSYLACNNSYPVP